MLTVVAILLSYVLGSIPTGLWLGLRLRAVDIREHGSLNIGATNTLRVLGKKLGALALAGDIAKGAVAVLVISRMGSWAHAPLACGLAAIVGHTASVFLRFKGGKSVATSAGVFLALCPVPTAIALATFSVVVALTKMVSAGSIAAAASLALAVNLISTPLPLRIVATVIAAIVILRHWGNIKRIAQGKENKL